jgi:pyridinium-3,5-bisthiocarboxylic acid mononucleotide nickel chelatase
MKIAYFDCFSGISGDMTIGALLDAGLSMAKLSGDLAELKLKGYRLKKSKVMRGAISGTKFDCIAEMHTGHGHRSLGDILKLIDKSALNNRVKSTAKRIFENIGAAEAKVHGVRSKESVYLHELGELDSIIDIVGAAIAIDSLGIDEVRSSNIRMGRTLASTMHGTIPIPGPAALELLKGVPVDIVEIRAELVTPTGAGIIKTLSNGFGAMTGMKVSAIGYGAGSRNLEEMPNMLRVVIGETPALFKGDTVTVVEANIDDMNPQYFEYVFERLFAEGALDVFITPILMKKSRPAFKLAAICVPGEAEKISAVMLTETTTIGVRFYEVARITLERKTVKVRTEYGEVSVKLSRMPDGELSVSPEYEDCARAARRAGSPLKLVYEQARRAAHKHAPIL